MPAFAALPILDCFALAFARARNDGEGGTRARNDGEEAHGRAMTGNVTRHCEEPRRGDEAIQSLRCHRPNARLRGTAVSGLLRPRFARARNDGEGGTRARSE